MPRPRRLLRLALPAILLCAALFGAQEPSLAQTTSTITVNTAADPFPPDGSCAVGSADGCTLREAINIANGKAASDTTTIAFDIAQGVPGYQLTTSPFPLETWTITLTQALPFLTHDGMVIDGFSQEENTPGTQNFLNGPTVIIDGSQLTSNSSGLTVTASNVTIKGLWIINFSNGTPGIGIDLLSGSTNTVQGCYIGIARSNSGAAANRTGIRVFNATNSSIGGRNTQPAERNIISGNQLDGIEITVGSGSKVQGNYIGLDLFGSTDIGNAGSGIYIYVSSNNTIGTSIADGNTTRGNVIAGNDKHGVHIQDGSGNTIAGNLIGVSTNGASKVANTLDGVRIESSGGTAANNKIGDTATVTRNTISGNGAAGIRIRGNNTHDNQVINNLIGLTVAGAALASNTQAGVVIESGAKSNTIGGAAAGQPNVISNNTGDGVSVSGSLTNNNVVAGNTIGLSESHLVNLGNTGRGVAVSGGASFTTIGGAGAAGNLIAANGGGVVISGTGTLSTTVLGNLVGVKKDAASSKLIVSAPNGGDGVLIGGAQYTRIGATGQGNTIVSSMASGIHVTGATTTTIAANLIGTIKDGATYLSRGNGQNGVRADGGTRAATIISNTIFYNGQNGVLVSDQGTQQVKISANNISRNGAKGIELDPDTTGNSGDSSNPNHDINPPFNLRLNQSGQLTGRVLTNPNNAAACVTCAIEIFTAERTVLDGEGRDQINTPVTISANGYFTATLPSVPGQLTLTATDAGGNTSEFAIFTATLTLDIGPAHIGTAKPGDVITYTHRVTNTGAVDFSDLLLSGFSQHNWRLSTLAPGGAFTVPTGESRPITLTLMLPTGADPRVAVNTVEHTRVTVASTAIPTATDSVTDTTTVEGKIVIVASPMSFNGSGTPSSVVPYAHTITNNGNITATLSLTASTDLAGWKTTITTTTLKLLPGQSAGVAANVTVPPNALTSSPPAKTTVTITPVNPADPSQTLILTDTTTVRLNPLATMTPAAIEVDAGATETAPLRHTVTNLSNGPATFKLSAISSLGSTISFLSIGGAQLTNGDTFTLGVDIGNNFITFDARVIVYADANQGQKDLITIYLTDTNGNVIGGASAQDTINVTHGAVRPRQYMPLILQQAQPIP